MAREDRFAKGGLCLFRPGESPAHRASKEKQCFLLPFAQKFRFYFEKALGKCCTNMI